MLDQMIVYASRRKDQESIPSFKLKDIVSSECDKKEYLEEMKEKHISKSIYAVAVYGFPIDSCIHNDEGYILAPQISPHIASDWWEDYEVADKLMLQLKDTIVKNARLEPMDIQQNMLYKTSKIDKNPILLDFLLSSITYQGLRIIENKVWERK